MGTNTTSTLPDIQPSLAAGDPVAMDQFNQALIAQFRATGGQLSGQLDGAPSCCSTRSAPSQARSARHRSATRAGDAYVIMASKSGSPTNPAWFHNLLASETATIEVAHERLEVRRRVVDGEERARLWERIVAQWPMAADYARATTHQNPDIVLESGGK